MNFPKMIGTTGTTFTVVGVFPAGHIGYRDIGGGQFRVRIAEYQTKESLSSLLPTWKQPDEYNVRTRRFSTVVTGVEGLGEAIAVGSQALSVASKGVVSTPAPAPSVTALTAKIDAAKAKVDAAHSAVDLANEDLDSAVEELERLQDLEEQLNEVLASV